MMLDDSGLTKLVNEMHRADLDCSAKNIANRSTELSHFPLPASEK